ncbi:MAG: TonB-dependent receptor [Desulfamplus sp.]|nr:TonB-dependent receptor [Desulfamplus sp.]
MKRWKKRHCSLLVMIFSFILFFVTNGSSQESNQKEETKVYKLDDVLITDQLIKGLEKKLHEEPATIHSISAEEINNLDTKRTLDLIRKIPGVTAENYNQQGVAAAYSFRGFRCGHGIGAASYLDGIPYNEINHIDGDGYPDYNTILPESLERLEVIKGLSSPLYGGYAQAGILHYITKDSGDYNKVKLSTGSWNYYKGVAEIAREKDNFFTYNAVSVDQGDGYRDHSDFDSGNVFSRFGYNIDDDSTIRLTLHSYNSDWNSPGSLSQADWDADNLKKAITDGGGNKEKNTVSVDYSNRLNQDSTINLLAYGYSSDFTRWVGNNNEERHDERDTLGSRAMYDFAGDLAGFKNNLVMGVDYETIDSQANKWLMEKPTNRVRVKETVSGNFDYQNTSLYLQENFWPADFIKFSMGGRYEFFNGDLKNNLTNKESSFSEEVFNPKGGILILPLDGVELFGNIGTGFVLPSGFKKFESEKLEPSELTSYDVGVRFLPIPETLFQLSLFRTDTTNEIITLPVTLEETNAGETKRQGVEASAEWYIKPDLQVYINGAYQDAKYVDYNTSSGNFAGKYINRVPEWIASTGVEYFPELGIGGSLTAKYTGERWSDNANTRLEEDFWVFDASLQYAMQKVTFTLFLNNIFDKKYAELQSADSYSPADPFNVTLSCSLAL